MLVAVSDVVTSDAPTRPVPLYLLLGDEELLVSRGIRRLVAAVRAADATADVRDLKGEEVEAGALLEMLSPSLFGGTTVLVIRAAQDLDEAARDMLVTYVSDPMDDTVLIVAHSGITKGKRLVDALKGVAVVTLCAKVTKPAERLEFVQSEIRAAGRASTAGACRALVDAVGSDLRELAAAVEQLLSDNASAGTVDERLVARFYRGRAETTGFQIADAAVAGDAAGALTLLRQALHSGTPDLLVVSALAGAVREIASVRGAGRGSVGSLAKQLGMPPWKVEKAQRAANRWSDPGLASALMAVAEADLSVKGGGVSPAYALERAVLSVARARGAA